MKKWLLPALLLAFAACTPKSEKELVAAFENPQGEAKPVMIWQWMDGWVTKEGITRELEAYAAAGIGGVQNFQVGGPEQTAFGSEGCEIGSPQWKELMRFAMEECARLGLTFGTHNCPGWSSSAYPDITPEYSMLEIVWTQTRLPVGRKTISLPQPRDSMGFYRDICVLAVPAGQSIVSDVTDISSSMSDDGSLSWTDAGAQSWDIYRFGYTTKGRWNGSTAPVSGSGLECDKMSREAVLRFWQGYPTMILEIAGDLAGKTLVNFEIDSYEQKTQTWTPKMEEEFASHRGYALRKWLPVLAGRTVESTQRSEQFLKDWQETIQDLFAENYYGYMSELVKQTPGMRLLIQPYGEPLDPEKVVRQDENFIICGEFWTNPPTWGGRSIWQVSDLAHRLGRREVYAEGFTCWPLNAWEDDPNSLKKMADRVFCVGINRLMLHAAASNPWKDARPGMTFGKWGTQFTPGNTWWEAGGAAALYHYFAQCQALLQRGDFVDNNDEGDLWWIHRRDGDIDIYFISNQKDEAVTVTLPFAQGLKLDSFGSEFVVTREGQRLPISLNPGGLRSALMESSMTAVQNSWTVDFPEGSGAPAIITLDKLQSLAENALAGVRFFSGTADYHTTFTSPSVPKAERLWLDLGEVRNMAEVFVNGKSCGLLWHAPFTVDITDAVRAGENELEVRVTNLWVNRMIGDEFEPDDVVWEKPERYSYAPGNQVAGVSMVGIPEWLQKGLPRPSQGRHAIVNTKFFTRDTPLLPSGLLGPVTLVTGSLQD